MSQFLPITFMPEKNFQRLSEKRRITAQSALRTERVLWPRQYSFQPMPRASCDSHSRWVQWEMWQQTVEVKGNLKNFSSSLSTGRRTGLTTSRIGTTSGGQRSASAARTCLGSSGSGPAGTSHKS